MSSCDIPTGGTLHIKSQALLAVKSLYPVFRTNSVVVSAFTLTTRPWRVNPILFLPLS